MLCVCLKLYSTHMCVSNLSSLPLSQLDLSSAFVLHAKASAAARVPKTKEKAATPSDKQRESSQKKSTKTSPRLEPSKKVSQTVPQPAPQRTAQRQKPNPHHARSTRTANRGPSRPKVAMGINGSYPCN